MDRGARIAIVAAVTFAATILAMEVVLAATPLLAVRGASMMRDDAGLARLGSIDPGDVVSLERAEAPAAAADGGARAFGAAGDVVVYRPGGDAARAAIAHRLLTRVEVAGDGAERTYAVAWPTCPAGVCRFGAEGVVLPELGFESPWRPPRSGLVTAGDNLHTNRRPDPALGICCPGEPLATCSAVAPEWVLGRATAELPALGLPHLALQGPLTPRATGGWLGLGSAFAPWDLWLLAFLAYGAPAAAAAVVAERVRRRDERAT